MGSFQITSLLRGMFSELLVLDLLGNIVKQNAPVRKRCPVCLKHRSLEMVDE